MEASRTPAPMVDNTNSAPIFAIPQRDIVAVEHPMIVKNLDSALKTFGTNRPFRRILDSDDPAECLPLYLRPQDPMAVPILSYNGTTNNILLQVTVPKRTGRKRKRGSQDPYVQFNRASSSEFQNEAKPPLTIYSQGRKDDPARLLRSLQDNVDKYTVEAVGHISQTHRFRGLSDFHHSTSKGAFVPRLKETMLSGDVSKMREFKFDPKMGHQENEELVPPPSLAGHELPFNWAWLQNPNVYTKFNEETGEKYLLNHSKNPEAHQNYISQDAKIITAPPITEEPKEESHRALVKDLREAFEERPIWTRRGLANRFGDKPYFYLLRLGIPYVGYQFKGGPFRDAIIKHGIDPRTDRKYRKYQTLFFKLARDDDKEPGMPWQDHRFGYTSTLGHLKVPTHIFDGKHLAMDGKIWQICDITDPLIVSIIESAPYRPTFDVKNDGWFTNGSLAKIRAIMKTKITAIQIGKDVRDEEFEVALQTPDIVIGGKPGRQVYVQVPDVRMTEAEIVKGAGAAVTSSGIRKRVQKRSHRKKIDRKRGKNIEDREDTVTAQSPQPSPEPESSPLKPALKPISYIEKAGKAKVSRPRRRTKLLPSEIWGNKDNRYDKDTATQPIEGVMMGTAGEPSVIPSVETRSVTFEDEDGEDESETGSSDTEEVDYQQVYGPDGKTTVPASASGSA